MRIVFMGTPDFSVNVLQGLIDNYGDEIQLTPEIVHVNSLMSLNMSFYRIRIVDYKDTKYLNINFTVLTGNADLEIYYDYKYYAQYYNVVDSIDKYN